MKKMTALESQIHLRSLLEKCRKDLDALFYYSEEEDLKRRGADAKSWSMVEILFHINLVNGAYLKNMPQIDKLEAAASDRNLKRSYLGRQIESSMALKPDGGMKIKMKTPSISDPRKAQKRGHAMVEQVVFREILTDLDTIRAYVDILDQKALEKTRVATLYPILKVNGADALFILLEHELRHLAQAARILNP